MIHSTFAGRGALGAILFALCSTAGCHVAPVTLFEPPQSSLPFPVSDGPSVAGKSASGAPLPA